MELIATAFALFTLAALYAAYVTNRRLQNLRSNCFIRNDKNQFTRWTKADAGTRARAETTTERTA